MRRVDWPKRKIKGLSDWMQFGPKPKQPLGSELKKSDSSTRSFWFWAMPPPSNSNRLKKLKLICGRPRKPFSSLKRRLVRELNRSPSGWLAWKRAATPPRKSGLKQRMRFEDLLKKNNN